MPRNKTERRIAARLAQERWRKKYPERVRAKSRRDRLKKYGITEEQWAAMQRRGCGICGTSKKLQVDHNHTTGKVRGALCAMHNNALGKFHDDPDEMRRAIRWVEEH